MNNIDDFTVKYRIPLLEARIEAKLDKLRDECIAQAKLEDELVWNTYIEDITHGEGLVSAIDIVEEL